MKLHSDQENMTITEPATGLLRLCYGVADVAHLPVLFRPPHQCPHPTALCSFTHPVCRL